VCGRCLVGRCGESEERLARVIGDWTALVPGMEVRDRNLRLAGSWSHRGRAGPTRPLHLARRQWLLTWWFGGGSEGIAGLQVAEDYAYSPGRLSHPSFLCLYPEAEDYCPALPFMPRQRGGV
jgi:hypothetical protein